MAATPDALADATVDRDSIRERVSETLSRLSRTGALPALPQAAIAALALARDPTADAERLCRLIQTDVGLSARVLRVANSVAYARRKSTTTLSAAVVTIGLRKTCDILVAASARRLYGAASRQAECLWNHALAVAIACEELARLTRTVDPGAAFLPGLFHDVGRIAFLLADRPSFEVIEGLADAADTPRPALETEWYGFDHAQAGGVLAEEWGLAQEQCDGIRWHHEPSQARLGRDIATLINAADALVYRLEPPDARPAPTGIGLAALGLSPEDEAECAARVQEAFVEQQSILS